MSRAFLHVGTRLEMDGRALVIERQCSDGTWVLRQQNTGRSIELTTRQIHDAYAAGELVFERGPMRKINGGERNSVPAEVRDGELDQARLRMAFVNAVAGLPCSKNVFDDAIRQTWLALDPRPPSPPGWVSVYRWLRAFRSSGSNPIALTAHHAGKGNRRSRLPPEVYAICDELVQSHYLCEERPGINHIAELLKARVRAANRLRPRGSQLPEPSRNLVVRTVAAIPAFDRYAARHGREAARRRFRTVLHQRITDAPLQRGEIDHTRLDLMVVDATRGLPLGRPWLTILLDDYSRCVLGCHISFEPPSRVTVGKCLRHACTPKVGLCEKFPDLVNDWPAHGVVSELVMDGGVEFHSQELQSICFELGIEQHFAPRKTPWFKGKVERLQGTLNRGVAVATPGKTFEGILERDDYDPMRHAVVTMETLSLLVTKWIVDVYHQKPHSALGCSPAQMWQAGIREHDIPLVADPLRFDAILGSIERRVLTHKGVEFAGLTYNSPELGDIRRTLGDRVDVEIRVDRSNLGGIIVLHPATHEPCRVPCLARGYAEGLTEWQHGVCKRYARDRLQRGGDPGAWLDALLAIGEIVERELSLGRRKGAARERLARWSHSGGTGTPAAGPPAPNVVALPVAAAPTAAPTPAEAAPVRPRPTARKRFAPIIEDRRTPPAGEDVGSLAETLR